MKKLYGFSAVILLWYMLSIIAGSRLVPFPHTAVTEFFKQLVTANLLLHGLASLGRLTAGIAAAMITGVPLGIAAGVSRRIDPLISPLVYILYPVPKIAFVPVFMVLFGLGDLSKILLLLSVLFFQMILAARDGVRSIPQELHNAALTLKLSSQERFWKLYLPSILPRLFSALRISVGIGIAVLFFAENYATDLGLGYYIMNNWIMINYPKMFAGILAISALAAGFLYFLDRLEKILCRWNHRDNDAI